MYVSTTVFIITQGNKYSRADVQFFSITILILALRDAFIQVL